MVESGNELLGREALHRVACDGRSAFTSSRSIRFQAPSRSASGADTSTTFRRRAHGIEGGGDARRCAGPALVAEQGAPVSSRAGIRVRTKSSVRTEPVSTGPSDRSGTPYANSSTARRSTFEKMPCAYRLRAVDAQGMTSNYSEPLVFDPAKVPAGVFESFPALVEINTTANTDHHRCDRSAQMAGRKRSIASVHRR